MSVPTLTATGGIYRLAWTDEAIFMQLDHVIESSKHEVSAEILIENRLPGTNPHIHQARLNLTSTAARKTLAGFLNAKNDTLPWTDLLEQACVLVLRKHREGTPAIRLASMTQPEGLEFRLFPFIQEHQATVLLGDGDTGKSYFAILLSTLIASNTVHLGLEPEPGAVLYLDYETDEATLWHRLNMVSAGLGIPIPDGILYRQMSQTIAADFDQINKLVVDEGISLVVVDSAAPASAEPEKSEFAIAYFNALRALKVSTLTVAHVSKEERENRPFGSIFWRNLPRALFRMNAVHDPGIPSFQMGIKHTKSNNGRRLKDMAFQVDFTNDDVRFSSANVMDIPELAKHATLNQQISAVLNRGNKTVKELTEILDGPSEGSIKTTLNRGRDKSFVTLGTNLGNTQWGNLHRE